MFRCSFINTLSMIGITDIFCQFVGKRFTRLFMRIYINIAASSFLVDLQFANLNLGILLPNTDSLQQVEDYVRGCTWKLKNAKTIYSNLFIFEAKTVRDFGIVMGRTWCVECFVTMNLQNHKFFFIGSQWLVLNHVPLTLISVLCRNTRGIPVWYTSSFTRCSRVVQQ